MEPLSLPNQSRSSCIKTGYSAIFPVASNHPCKLNGKQGIASWNGRGELSSHCHKMFLPQLARSQDISTFKSKLVRTNFKRWWALQVDGLRWSQLHNVQDRIFPLFSADATILCCTQRRAGKSKYLGRADHKYEIVLSSTSHAVSSLALLCSLTCTDSPRSLGYC